MAGISANRSGVFDLSDVSGVLLKPYVSFIRSMPSSYQMIAEAPSSVLPFLNAMVDSFLPTRCGVIWNFSDLPLLKVSVIVFTGRIPRSTRSLSSTKTFRI